MKTWILMAASSGAAVYLYDSITQRVNLARRIQYRRSPGASAESRSDAFAHYLAEEMDVACGAGTNARLAVFADAKMLGAILKNIAQETKSVVVRTLKVPALASEVTHPEFPEGCWSTNRILNAIRLAPNRF
jgi:hypothetical protein